MENDTTIEGRDCGGCTLCCHLLSVYQLHKRAGENCVHQGRDGCGTYNSRPDICQQFFCHWRSGVAGKSRSKKRGPQ